MDEIGGFPVAKVRVTAWCQGCESYIDTTVHASKAERIVAGFSKLHDAACFEEDPRGEDQAKPAAGASGPQDEGEVPAATTGPEDRTPVH